MEIIFTIFEKYGWWGLIAIVLCTIICMFIKWLGTKIINNMRDGFDNVGHTIEKQLIEQQNTITNQLAKQQNDMADTLIKQQKQLVEYIINKDKTTIKTHNDMLNKRIEFAEDINIMLKDIMQIHKSQRAFIIEFHNSYENLSGIPFAKYSCTYEWFEKGLTPLSTKCLALPFSQMSRIVKEMINSENQQIIYTDMHQMELDNPSLFASVKDPKTKAIVYTGMFDRHNQLIGCLVLEYQIPLSKGNLNLSQLKLQTSEITSILNIKYKITKYEE